MKNLSNIENLRLAIFAKMDHGDVVLGDKEMNTGESLLNSRLKTYIAITMGVFILWLAYYTSSRNYLLFHTVAELFTIIISFTIALIVFNNYKKLNNDFIPIIGISYAFAGFFDLLHTLAFEGLGVFPDYGPNLAPQMWLIARFLDSMGMLMAGVSFDKTIKPLYVLIIYFTVSIAALLSVFAWGVFPVAFIAGQGLTPFKINSEYVICAILIISMIQLMRQRFRFHPKVYLLLLIFYSTSIGTELSFTLYRQMYGLENTVGHLFKITAFFFLYRAIVETSLKEPFDLLFFQLNQAYNNLKENEVKLLEAQHIAQVGIFEYDIVQGRMYWSNQMYINMGYAVQEIIPTMSLFLGRVHPDDRGYLENAFIRNFSTASGEIEIRINKADGTVGWLHIRHHIILNEQREPTKVFGITQDVTENKKSEAQLEHYAAELADRNQEIKSFANIVSHDLRSPLINLKGFSQELGCCIEELKQIFTATAVHFPEAYQKQMDRLFEQDVPEALRFIDTSVNRMDRMIAALLKLSRLGRRELQYEEIEMDELVSSILQSFQHQIEQGSIQVEVSSLPRINSDQLAIEQIVGNLVDNALKYLDRERRGEVRIGCTDNGDEFFFIVEDNGIGISPREHEKIFDIFWRVEKRDIPGEGMGLAYVKTLVRQLGGKVWCESQPGIGTKMIFSVPKWHIDAC